MKKTILSFLPAMVTLWMLGVSAQAQPSRVTELPSESTNFVTAGDLVYFTSGDSLLRTDGTNEGTILLRSSFTGSFSNFTEFNDMLFFVSGDELWRSDGTAAGTILMMSKSDLRIFTGAANTL